MSDDNNSTFYKLVVLSFLIIVVSAIIEFFDQVFDRNTVIQYFMLMLIIFNIYNLIKKKN